MTDLPILDTYWVVQDQLLAGAYPGDMQEEKARRKIQLLIQREISFIIDLTRPEDTFCPYVNLLAQEAEEYGKEVNRINYPIADYDIPSVSLMTEILNTIDQAVSSGQKVYFHCVGGIGRTGTVAGCYLARHGLNGKEALAQLQILRRDVATSHYSSPESDFQREFVMKWPVGS
jgi:protein-tyrosine phosphatase